MPGTPDAYHSCKCLLIFVAAFALAMGALKSAGGFPQVPELKAKRDRWVEMKDEVDTVFVGSSRTFHHIDPVTFSDAVAAAGLPRPHAYNAGANLMFPPESLRWVRELLAERPPKLKWVFLELAGIRSKGEFGEGFETSARGVWWHDVPHTRMSLHHVWRDGRLPVIEKLDESVEHLSQAATVMSGAGRKGETISHLLMSGADVLEDGMNPATGFQAFNTMLMSEDEIASYRRQLAGRLAAPPPPVRALPSDLRVALKDLRKEINRAGAELVLFEPPAGIPLSRPIQPLPGVMHLRYNDVEAHTDLYAPEQRRDGGHLMAEGARLFSAQLGRDFAALVKKQPEAAR